MPILEIEIVLGPGESLAPDLAARLAQAAAEALRSSPGRTWVKLRTLPLGHYAEDAGGPPEGIYPVFVSVLKASRPQRAELHSEVERLTCAVARACGRPTQGVHVLYELDARGRLAFGGEIVPG